MLKADFFYRAVPWARLMLRVGKIPNDLNVKWPQRIAALVAWALMGTLAAGAAQHSSLWAGPLLVMLLITGLDRLTHNPVMAIAAGYLVSAIMIGTLIIYGVLLKWWVIVPIALSVAIVFLNWGFYRLLSRQQHFTFPLFVFPLNVLFYLYSSVAFGWAAVQHAWRMPVQLKSEEYTTFTTKHANDTKGSAFLSAEARRSKN
jgi:hypothetical protein